MEGPISDNLYMKGLPAGTTDDTLRVLFGAYGAVTSCRLLSPPCGMSDVAALVRMSNIHEAQYLVENAASIATRLSLPLQIRYAANVKGKGKCKLDAGASMMPAPLVQPTLPGQPSTRLYMKGLPFGIAEDHLRAVIGAYGSIVSVKILTAPPGATDSACIVQMASPAEAQWIVDNLDGNIPQGFDAPIVVKFKTENLAPRTVPTVPSLPATSGAGGLGGFTPPLLKLEAQGGSPSPNLHLKGLPAGAGAETIRAIFSAYGTVTSCTLLPPLPGASDICCLLSMGSTGQAKWLVDNVNGNMPLGLTDPITIRFADSAANATGVGAEAAVAEAALTLAASMANLGSTTTAITPWQPIPNDSAQATWPGMDDDQPSDNLYMKGLPLDTTEGALRGIFSAYGNVVSCKVLPSQGTDVAALVRMGSTAEAQWLVDNVNGNIPQGLPTSRPVTIKFANNSKACGKGCAPPAGPPGAVALGAALPAIAAPPAGALPDAAAATTAAAALATPAGGKPVLTVSDNLYMKGFDADVGEQLVRDIMGQYGRVVSVKVLPAPPGKSCVACLVRMSSVSEATWIVENMNGNIPAGTSTPVEVRYANNAGKGARRSTPY